jgi:hypothetical protein
MYSENQTHNWNKELYNYSFIFPASLIVQIKVYEDKLTS